MIWQYKIKFSHLFLVIFVESLPRLETEFALGDEFIQQRDGFEELLVRELFVPAVEDELVGIEADVVRQFERAHGVAGAKLHGDVDIAGWGVTCNAVRQPVKYFPEIYFTRKKN